VDDPSQHPSNFQVLQRPPEPEALSIFITSFSTDSCQAGTIRPAVFVLDELLEWADRDAEELPEAQDLDT